MSAVAFYESAASLVHYCPLSGVFRWRWRDGDDSATKRFNTLYAGRIAGSRHSDGYLQASVMWGGKQRHIFLHRLAYFISHGVLPEDQIDHINGVCDDNRLLSLRGATPQENMQNLALLRNNTSGHAGVNWRKDRNKWQARVWKNGRAKQLGLYSSKDEAAEVAQLARDMLGFSPRHGKLTKEATR